MNNIIDAIKKFVGCKKNNAWLIVAALGVVAAGVTFFAGKKMFFSNATTYAHNGDDIEMLIDRKVSSTTEKIAQRLVSQVRDVLDDLKEESNNQVQNDVDQRIRDEVKRQLRSEDDDE